MTDEDTFRIGNIGEIYPGDILNVTGILPTFSKNRSNVNS